MSQLFGLSKQSKLCESVTQWEHLVRLGVGCVARWARVAESVWVEALSRYCQCFSTYNLKYCDARTHQHIPIQREQFIGLLHDFIYQFDFDF